ncbi:hypothetical protein IV500_10700 [Paeniglutamicibacter antarcticus]|uniref:Uncharacterized protein n=1 Tax=Arthrobacter terrae TaxID=2935737 RepID=A0A931CRV3_9MICC|nr:hypothetical protein [Arthrobacter terrae]MBG0739854.1 hypothetical protein [Arthrobacter terrae]
MRVPAELPKPLDARLSLRRLRAGDLVRVAPGVRLPSSLAIELVELVELGRAYQPAVRDGVLLLKRQ